MSWLEIDPDSDFSLKNIPFGVCSVPPRLQRPRCCTAVGSVVIDLSKLSEAGLFSDIANFSSPYFVFSRSTLNSFMELSKQVWVDVRNRIICLLTKDDRLRDNLALQEGDQKH